MKFSILIPAYKATFLKECIDSIFAQTYKDFELIIVNDASPEDLDSIVKLYDDKRIRYFVNETNCGAVNVVDNWNKCLSHATGDYVICMGDDDKLMPICLEEYFKLITKYPNLNAFHARVVRIDDNSNVIDILEDRAEHESIYSFMRHRFNRRMQYIGDFCFKTTILKEMGGYYKLPLAWDSDDITAYMMVHPLGIANTNKATFMYRVNAFTISNIGNNTTKLQAISQAGEWIFSFLEKLSPISLEDREEWKLLHKLAKRSIDIEKTIIVYSSYQRSVLNAFKWMMHKTKYGLTYKHILKALIYYVNANNKTIKQ